MSEAGTSAAAADGASPSRPQRPKGRKKPAASKPAEADSGAAASPPRESKQPGGYRCLRSARNPPAPHAPNPFTTMRSMRRISAHLSIPCTRCNLTVMMHNQRFNQGRSGQGGNTDHDMAPLPPIKGTLSGRLLVSISASKSDRRSKQPSLYTLLHGSSYDAALQV